MHTAIFVNPNLRKNMKATTDSWKQFMGEFPSPMWNYITTKIMYISFTNCYCNTHTSAHAALQFLGKNKFLNSCLTILYPGVVRCMECHH